MFIIIIIVMLEMMMVCIEGVQLCLLKRWVNILGKIMGGNTFSLKEIFLFSLNYKKPKIV